MKTSMLFILFVLIQSTYSCKNKNIVEENIELNQRVKALSGKEDSLSIKYNELLKVFNEVYVQLENPNFMKQKELNEKYKILPTESICERPDFQNIYNYNGSLGPSIEFVLKKANSVGAISRNNRQGTWGRYCSGTLISNNLFLTASHCIDNSIKSYYVAFNYQYESDNKLAEQDFYKITRVLELGYKKDIDYAILELEGNPGEKYGFLPISIREPLPNDLLTIIQHPGGLPKLVEAGLFDINIGKWIKYRDLDTEKGSSGSGILNDRGEIIGVHTMGGCDDPKIEVNHGMNMQAIAEFSPIIRNLILED